MSLIHDALRVAQRERAAQPQSDKNPPQVIDGFFPYVSSSSNRANSRRALIVAASGAVVVLLAITAWLMWPKETAPKRAPIILPPPITVSKTPPAPDSAAAAAPAPDPQVAAAAAQNEAAVIPERSKSVGARPNAVRSDAGRATQPTQGTITPVESVERRDSIPAAPIRFAAPRVDYEAQATLLFNAGDLPGAKEKFELATRFAPNARAWTNYGVTLQRLGDFTGASSAYQSAIGLDANYLEAWLYQARLAAEQGDIGKAIPLLQRARAINPRNADVNVELARLECDAKNWTEAKRFAEEALRADATNIRAFWYLAVASDPLKDTDGSIRGYAGYLQYVGDAPDQAKFIGWARSRLAQLRAKP